MSFIAKYDGMYYCGGRSGRWEEGTRNARTYSRKADVRNSLGMHVEIIEVAPIPLTELAPLQDAYQTLLKLEAAGVDNWEGYSYAMTMEDEE